MKGKVATGRELFMSVFSQSSSQASRADAPDFSFTDEETEAKEAPETE